MGLYSSKLYDLIIKFAPMLLKPTLTKLNDLGEYIERAPISQYVTFQFLYGKYLLIVGDYNEVQF